MNAEKIEIDKTITFQLRKSFIMLDAKKRQTIHEIRKTPKLDRHKWILKPANLAGIDRNDVTVEQVSSLYSSNFLPVKTHKIMTCLT